MMKQKMKLLWMILILAFIVTGCGEKEELETMPPVSLEDVINTDVEADEEECPEGYVYDYQVSMEPIPEEIAALGGEVCGTIHAYPTEILIRLAQNEIENNAELQQQNKKNTKALYKYLVETYGGDFKIEPLTTKYEYICTEVSSDKKFVIYISPLFEYGITDEIVKLDTYYYEENAEGYKKRFEEILESTIGNEYVFETFCESGAILNLYVAIFSEKEPNYIEEQKKIIQIYNVMKSIQQENAEKVSLRLVITYFPQNYQDIIVTQYQSKCRDDFLYIINECASKLIEQCEVYAQFEYSEKFFGTEENNLDDIVANKEKYYENEYILPYWRGIE